jgi:polysaccharide biosynthesis/export protein
MLHNIKGIYMRDYSFVSFSIGVLMCIAGCSATGGDIVKTVSVETEKAPLSGLKDTDLAMLAQIKKTSAGAGASAAELRTVVTGETRHFTVAEYMQLHPEAYSRTGRDYIVGGNDVLSITVYEEADLSRESIRVSADGYISFPLISRLKVEGLSTADIGELIARRLAEGQYLLNAHVSVIVTEYNSKWYLVLGAVTTPGSYPLTAQERILNAISKAGGIKETGAGKKAKIVRTEMANTSGEKQIVIDIDLQGILQGTDPHANMLLCDKDTLFIPTAESFYIIGQVKSPGSYPLIDRELTLVEGIGIAGGFTNIAARNHTRIIRIENGEEKIIEVKVDAITEGGKKIRDVIIQPNDIIIVPESFF